MGEAEKPLRAQTLLSDAHIDVQKHTKKSGALDEGRDTAPTPKLTTVEAGWRQLREGSRITLPKKRSIEDT